MERLCDLLFEVSNEVRLTILQRLEGGTIQHLQALLGAGHLQSGV